MTETPTDFRDMTIKRFKISLPFLYHRRLMLWAWVKGTNRATLASNILQARIESNWEGVKEQLEDIAKLQGITREELEILILEKNQGEDD